MGLLERFYDKVAFIPFHDCWEWTGGDGGQKNGRPYGKLGGLQAHRVSYELHVGPIPQGFVIDHLCRNTMCVRPEHLDAVTQIENMRRARHTHCKNGHLLTAVNLYIHPKRGYRECQKCRDRRSKARNRRTR